jgi:predicted ATPase
MQADAAMAEPIIGRRAELQALAQFLQAVPAGGRALLIEGDAGIGKTALLHEGVRRARASSVRVLTARPAPAEAQMAFTTIGDLFTQTLGETLP